MSFLKDLLDFLTTPSNFLLMLACLGALALLIRWRRVGGTCLALGLGGFLAFGYTSLSEVMIAPLVQRFPPVDAASVEPPFGLIVLGGGMNEVHADTMGALMDLGDGGEAVPIAVLLAQRFPQARLVLIDGAGPIPSPLRPAEGMRRVMLEFGIDPARIAIDPDTVTTEGRVRSAIALMGDRPDAVWWVLTPAHRMPRVIGVFRAQGVEPVPYPIDFEWIPPFDPGYFYPLTGGLRLTDLGAHEWRGLLSYYLSGKIDRLFPGPLSPERGI